METHDLRNNYYINEICKLLKSKNKNYDYYKKVRLEINQIINFVSYKDEIRFPHVILDNFYPYNKYVEEYKNIIMDKYVNDLFEIITKFGDKPTLFGEQEFIIKQTLIKRIKENRVYSYIRSFGINDRKLREIKFDYIYKNS